MGAYCQKLLHKLREGLEIIQRQFDTSSLPTAHDWTPGICECLEDVMLDFSGRHLRILEGLWQSWPEFSGNIYCPVPALPKGQIRNLGNAPVWAFVQATDLWDEDTQYGRARVRLLKWLIHRIQEMTNVGSN